MRGRSWVWVGWACYGAAFPLVAADTDGGGELVRGFDVRGYQCFLSAFLALFVQPPAAPIWIAVILANVTAVLAPALLWWPAVRRAARVTLPAGAVAAWAMLPLGTWLGVPRVHVGYYVWAVSLTVLAIAVWRLPRRA